MKKNYFKAGVALLAMAMASTSALAETKTLEFDFSFPINTGGVVGVAYDKDGKAMFINKEQQTFTANDVNGVPYLFNYFHWDNQIYIGYYQDALQIGASSKQLWNGQLVLGTEITDITKVEVTAMAPANEWGAPIIMIATAKEKAANGEFQVKDEMWCAAPGQTPEKSPKLTNTYTTYTWEGSTPMSGNLMVKGYSGGNYWFRIQSIKITYEGEATATAEPLLFDHINKTEDTERYYGTFSAPKDVIFPATAGVEVYTATTADGSLALNKLEVADYASTSELAAGKMVNGYLVPANTGVLVSMNSASTSFKTAHYLNYDGTAAAISVANQLEAAATGKEVYASPETKYFTLGYADEANTQVGFNWAHSTTGTFIAPARTAYLAVPMTEATTINSYLINGSTISGAQLVGADNKQGDNAIYNLQGIRLNEVPDQGIYIVNGKKHMKR